jgi:hypothetical protein
MSDNHRTNIGISLLGIHHCITRGIEVSLEHSQGFLRSGYPNESTRAGFHSYVRSLASVVHAHHLSEDEVAFPYFKNLYPQIPFDTLADTHRKIIPLLEAVNLALDNPGEGSKLLSSKQLQEVIVNLTALDALWRPHIQIEESYLTPQKMDETVSLAEQQKLAMEIGQHIQKHAVPDYLTVPFTLFNLESGERQYMAAEMPPIVTQQLVPQVWKEKWAPMLPFLLQS